MSASHTENDPPTEEKVNTWFWEPLESLRQKHGKEAGYAMLMILLPLYERYLRITSGYGYGKGRESINSSIPEGEQLYELMASDFNLLGIESKLKSSEVAQLFWTGIRHGLLHQGIPQDDFHRKLKMQVNVKFDPSLAVPVEGSYSGESFVFALNVMMVYDVILKLLKANLDMWDSDKPRPGEGGKPLPKVFSPVNSELLIHKRLY